MSTLYLQLPLFVSRWFRHDRSGEDVERDGHIQHKA